MGGKRKKYHLLKTKKGKNLALTGKQIEDLWDNRGPYSEVNLKIESRILDEKVWRVWVKVYAIINPFTFEFIAKHKEYFSNDWRVTTILRRAEYDKKERGYVSHIWSAPYMKGAIDTANQMYKETEEAIIRMHKFLINNFDIDKN